ncbi:MAG: hypothetical protein LBL79_02630 [Prevotella sp.]|jgi:threonyl-tRNA synthetase|nr:hypothetical protein [Prevotella sp.]
MKKVYFSKNKAKIVFTIKVGDVVKNISFSNFGGSYSTSGVEEQKVIEDTFYFKNGLIYSVSEKKPEKKQSDKVKMPARVYDNVTDINGAVATLKGEPYKVHHMKLKDPASVIEQAELNDVSFPNWKVE